MVEYSQATGFILLVTELWCKGELRVCFETVLKLDLKY